MPTASSLNFLAPHLTVSCLSRLLISRVISHSSQCAEKHMDLPPTPRACQTLRTPSWGIQETEDVPGWNKCSRFTFTRSQGGVYSKTAQITPVTCSLLQVLWIRENPNHTRYMPNACLALLIEQMLNFYLLHTKTPLFFVSLCTPKAFVLDTLLF